MHCGKRIFLFESSSICTSFSVSKKLSCNEMGFGDLKTPAGLQALNTYLQDKSYIEGYVPSQADTVVFGSMSGAPNESLPHALRWYNHIASYGTDTASFPGDKKAAEKHIGSATSTADTGSKNDDDDDDDVDLFGSSSDEDDEEAEKIKKERLEAYYAKKAKKPAVVAKSSIILDVKPWDDETDLAEIEKSVRGLAHDGLLWGASKLVPMAYGIKKLQISCVVEDDKVGTDFLEENITGFEELVQSVDVVAFNKL